jgi:hypothetical protein
VGFSNSVTTKKTLIDSIQKYIDTSSNLKINWSNDSDFEIFQSVDSRQMKLNIMEIEEVLPRSDHEGEPFLQINLSFDRKILITRNLIGFKPINITGLDMNRLPKVVTTADLISVIETIEDLMTSDQHTAMIEIDILKKVYHAILSGGEKVGFSLDQEKQWLSYSFNPFHKASA